MLSNVTYSSDWFQGYWETGVIRNQVRLGLLVSTPSLKLLSLPDDLCANPYLTIHVWYRPALLMYHTPCETTKNCPAHQCRYWRIHS